MAWTRKLVPVPDRPVSKLELAQDCQIMREAIRPRELLSAFTHLRLHEHSSKLGQTLNTKSLFFSNLLQFFYEEQLHRMECLAHEPVLFEDILCQMHDMIQPKKEGVFTLADLKRTKPLSGTLFNILFNLNKFVAFETRDPFL